MLFLKSSFKKSHLIRQIKFLIRALFITLLIKLTSFYRSDPFSRQIITALNILSIEIELNQTLKNTSPIIVQYRVR